MWIFGCCSIICLLLDVFICNVSSCYNGIVCIGIGMVFLYIGNGMF